MSLLALTAVITAALTATAPLNTAGWFMIDAPTLRELVAEHRLLGCPSAAANKPCTNMPAAAC